MCNSDKQLHSYYVPHTTTQPQLMVELSDVCVCFMIHNNTYMYTQLIVCGFIKQYKHDFEVMKYNCYIMPTRAISGL